MKRVLTLFVAAALLAGGLYAAAAVAGGSTSGGTSGGASDDFVYSGQTISHASYGPPWVNNADAAAGWIETPLSFECQPGTLLMTPRVQYTDDKLTQTFDPPKGAVVLGVLWATQVKTTVASATWANDGSTANVTMAGSGIGRVWSDSRIFYCVPTEVSTQTTTVTTPSTTGTTTVTTPGSTVTATTPGTTTTFTPPPPHKKHHKRRHHRQIFTPPNVKLPHTM
jgi:hypothetical protein